MRVNAYTISSFFFVTGSALGYVSPLIVSAFKGRGHGVLSGVHHVLCDLADGSCGDVLRADLGHLHRRVAADVPAGKQIRQEAR